MTKVISLTPQKTPPKAPIKPATKRKSTNAAAVAHDVIKEVGKGRKVSLRKIIPKHGYAPSVADNPKKITEQSAYKNIVDPFVKKMENERDRIINQLQSSKLSKVRYKDLIDALDKLTKNIQLLTGGQTENFGLTEYATNLEKLRKEIMNKKK